MSSVCFSFWLECNKGDEVEREYHHAVSLRQTKINDGFSIFGLPYLTVENVCDVFQYEQIWREELSRTVDLRLLGLRNDDSIFSLIAQCFMAYLKAKETDIIPRGYVDTLDGSFMMDDGAARKVEVERRSRIWAKAFPNRPFVLTDDDGVHRFPFIVKGHCDNFQQYCSRWFTQIGPYFKLVENGVRDGGHLYYFLKIAFNQFQAIMQQPQFDDLLIEVGEEASSGFGSGSENFSEEE